MSDTMTAHDHPPSQEKIPGTVLLVDVDHISQSQHAGRQDIVLIPTPSNDPDDPLNWSKTRKILGVVCFGL